ncbi:hypothetical protein GCM10027168_15720 [Streptomyces capparidis]
MKRVSGSCMIDSCFHCDHKGLCETEKGAVVQCVPGPVIPPQVGSPDTSADVRPASRGDR